MTINFETASYDEIRASDCPHCGICLENGLLHVTDEMANSETTYAETKSAKIQAEWVKGEWECMGCGGHFGKPVTYGTAKVAKPHQGGVGIKIQKNREERNGVKRPSAGGKCAAVWEALDGYVLETGEQPTSKGLRHACGEMGWNVNNAMAELSLWRKFNA